MRLLSSKHIQEPRTANLGTRQDELRQRHPYLKAMRIFYE